jgi:hypothetical protein
MLPRRKHRYLISSLILISTAVLLIIYSYVLNMESFSNVTKHYELSYYNYLEYLGNNSTFSKASCKDIYDIVISYLPIIVISQADELPTAFFNTSMKPVTFVHCIVDNGFLSIQYWFYYSYNKHLLSIHEHDWEMVYIVLSVEGGLFKPLIVGYGIHGLIYNIEWRMVQREESRPYVYVAFGSHASYPCNEETCTALWIRNTDIIYPPIRTISNYTVILIESVDAYNIAFYVVTPNKYSYTLDKVNVNIDTYKFGNIKPPWSRTIWFKVMSNSYMN